MWQINYCPNCGARSGRDDSFCGTCGFNLLSVMPQVPPPLMNTFGLIINGCRVVPYMIKQPNT